MNNQVAIEVRKLQIVFDHRVRKICLFLAVVSHETGPGDRGRIAETVSGRVTVDEDSTTFARSKVPPLPRRVIDAGNWDVDDQVFCGRSYHVSVFDRSGCLDDVSHRRRRFGAAVGASQPGPRAG